MSLIRLFTPSHTTSNFSPLARLSAFQHEMERFLDQPRRNLDAAGPDHWSPAFDLYQDKDNLLLKMELPGMNKEDITLSLHDGLLTITGERRRDEAHSNNGPLRNERFFGQFERTINMPTQVDGTRVSASYENGILTVTLPKAEAAKPRQIEISVK